MGYVINILSMRCVLVKILEQNWFQRIATLWPSFLIVAIFLNANISFGQFEQPYLKYLEPICLTKSETTYVNFFGDNLGIVQQAISFRNGLKINKSKSQKLEASVAQNTEDGLYQISPRGSFGFSNPRSYVVSDFKSILLKKIKFSEIGGIRNYEQIQQSVWVDGYYDQGKVYRFPISLEPGRDYTFLCLTSAIGSRLRPVISIRDNQLKLIQRTNNSGVLSFSNPESTNVSQIFFELRDQTFDGGREFTFCFIALPEGTSLQPWLRFASLLRSPHLPFSLTLPPELNASEASNQNSLPILKFEDKIDDNDQFIDWEGAQNIDIAMNSLTKIIKTDSQGGDHVHARFKAPADGLYFFETISHRIGERKTMEMFLYDIDKQQAKPIATGRPTNASPSFGKLHTAHYDSSLSYNLRKGASYGIKLLRDSLSQNRAGGGDVYLRVFPENDSHGGVVILPEYPPNKDPNSRKLFSQSLNFIRGQKLKAKVIAIRNQGGKKRISVDFRNLPKGLKANPEVLEFRENESEKFVQFYANDDSQFWFGFLDIPVALIGENNKKSAGFLYSSNGPIWNVGDYNNEYSEFIVQKGVVAQIDDKLGAPIQLISGHENPLRLKENSKTEIEFEIVRSKEVADSEITLRDFSRTTKLPEIKFKPGQSKATLLLDIAQLKWKFGKYNPNYAIEIKHKFTDRGNEDKTEKKDYTFFALDDLWTIIIEK